MSSIVKVDTIQENTSANGITVDGLNIKDSKLVTSNSVVAANITADAIDATKIADNAISEEHLDVTSITGHGALTSVANDDLILLSDTSDSAALKKMTVANLTANVGGGSLVKLASTTISSGVAAVSFNSTYINSTYDNYRVIAYGLSTASDNQDIALRMSVDNGSNFATHVGVFNYTQINHSGGAQQTVGNRTSLPLGSDEEADASGGTNFIIDLMNLNSTAQYKFVNGLGTTVNQNGSYYCYRAHAYIASNTAVNFIKVFTEAGGNLDGGTVTLYGYEK
jgi:hypothetical protein